MDLVQIQRPWSRSLARIRQPVIHAKVMPTLSLKVRGVLLQHMGICIDKTDRIIQLVGDTGNQTAERGQLFTAHQMTLRFLQDDVACLKLSIGTADISNRLANQNCATASPALIQSGRRRLQYQSQESRLRGLG